MKMKAKKKAVREKLEEAERVAKLLADAEKRMEVARVRLRGSRGLVSGEGISPGIAGRGTFSAAKGGKRIQGNDIEMTAAMVQNGRTR
jgi:hypothetical protein